MATNASINVKDRNKVKNIYLHWDGYPERALRILKKHYNNQKIALELVNLGDLSILEPRIHPTSGKEHSFDNPQKGVNIYYDRDRNDHISKVKTFNSLEDALKYNSSEYNYYFDGKEWKQVNKDGVLIETSFKPLAPFKEFLKEQSEHYKTIHGKYAKERKEAKEISEKMNWDINKIKEYYVNKKIKASTPTDVQVLIFLDDDGTRFPMYEIFLLINAKRKEISVIRFDYPY